MRKKILLWCGDAPNQRALACKVAAKFSLAGIVIQSRNSRAKRSSPIQLFSKIIDRLRFGRIYDAWSGLQDHYRKKYPEWPQAKILRIENINSKEAADFSLEIAPDLIIVSGTALIKKPLLDIPATIGIINLHTGLSPYVKGGPNCTNWCIANNEWHLIGNTIMWINAGIDSGNIITTETIDLRSSNTLLEAQISVMEHAHDLYIKAIGYLIGAKLPYVSVPQTDFPVSKLYLTKMWTAQKRTELLKNWRNRNAVTLDSHPRTVSLPL